MFPAIIAPASPILPYSELQKVISTPRLAAYSREDDSDSSDAVARYMWNMALIASLWPAVHVLEVAVRNALFEVGERVAKYTSREPVRCWLTAGVLEVNEEEEVQKALGRLGPGRRTPGHLVAELTFGFWVRMCNRPYEHGRTGGPRLWPEAAKRFHGCPRVRRNREDIRTSLEEAAELRNRMAHHHPLWDRRPDKRLNELVGMIAWISSPMADAVKATSLTKQLLDGGHTPFRPLATGLAALTVQTVSVDGL